MSHTKAHLLTIVSSCVLGCMLTACASSDELPATESDMQEVDPNIREQIDRPDDPTTQKDASSPYEEDMTLDISDTTTDVEDMPEEDLPTQDTTEDVSDQTQDMPEDMPVVCPPDSCLFGQAMCSGMLVQNCVEGPDGCPTWGMPEPCPDNGMCSNDKCEVVISCMDGDGDGYGPGCVNGADCDDMDPERNFGRLEECDGKDNDCNGMVDDGLMGTGVACTSGFAACETSGTTVCDPMTKQIVCGAVPDMSQSMPETCDMIDNDCNGQVDDGSVCGIPMCANDAQESNDTIATAFMLPADSHNIGLVCQTDQEYFQLSVTPGIPNRINLAFPHSLGNLDLAVYEDGQLLGVRNTTTDNEIGQFTPVAGKTYVAQVRNVDVANTFYVISTTSSWGCSQEDAFEPNDTISKGTFLPSSWNAPAYTCGDDDWYYMGNIPANTQLRIKADFTTGLFDYGDIDIDLYGDDNNDGTFDRLSRADSSGWDETLNFTTTFEGRYYFKVYPYTSGETNDYRIQWTK